MRIIACLIFIISLMCTMDLGFSEEQQVYTLDQIMSYLEIDEDILQKKLASPILMVNATIFKDDFLKEFPPYIVRTFYQPYDQGKPSEYAMYKLVDEMNMVVFMDGEDKEKVSCIMVLRPLCTKSFFLGRVYQGVPIDFVYNIDPNMIENLVMSSRHVSNHIMDDGSYFEVTYDIGRDGKPYVKTYREIPQEECTTYYRVLHTCDLI